MAAPISALASSRVSARDLPPAFAASFSRFVLFTGSNSYAPMGTGHEVKLLCAAPRNQSPNALIRRWFRTLRIFMAPCNWRIVQGLIASPYCAYMYDIYHFSLAFRRRPTHCRRNPGANDQISCIAAERIRLAKPLCPAAQIGPPWTRFHITRRVKCSARFSSYF